jgi:prepilin-type N-terminal cleavage/methylation domain-containing protein
MNKSFTLIEILVVIVVIGVLSAFILVGMSSITSSANIAKGQAFFNSMRNSLLINLVSEWKLNQNGNDSWGSNNGAVSGATSTNSGCVKDYCYSFNGINNFIQIPHSSNLKPTSKITVVVWAQKDNWQNITTQAIISVKETGGYAINSELGGNNMSFFIYINGAYYYPAFYDTTVPSSGWHCFIGTFDSRYVKTYLDGVYRNQSDVGSSFPYYIQYNCGCTNSLFIGAEAGADNIPAGQYFSGKIDEVGIYSESIPSVNIKQIYYSGLNSLIVKNEIDSVEYLNRLSELKNNSAKQ